MFCKYADMFGIPGQGLHKYRIFNIAIADVLLTFIVAYLINLMFPKYSYITILIMLFLVGIMLHRIFCVKTTIDKLIFVE